MGSTADLPATDASDDLTSLKAQLFRSYHSHNDKRLERKRSKRQHPSCRQQNPSLYDRTLTLMQGRSDRSYP